jgi:hypothetical protein
MKLKFLIKSIALILLFIGFSTNAATAQTSTFVYQGKLQDSGLAANGTYQFQFKLYDAETGGNQVSLSITGVTAVATNGIFAVNLNFGAGAFNSPDFRFLEIGVRPNGSAQPYTILNPRQQVTSTPYAIRALSAQNADHAATADDSANLGGIPAAQYVITTDPRMSDERSPLPNSGHYIQNGTNQQASSNFNVSGEGKALKMTGVLVNATSEFQQGGTRVMQFNAQKSGVVGVFTGPNSTGSDNMFVGYQAGNANLTGSVNTFVGSQTGKSNTTGFNNSFFGAYSGFSNITGTNNAFFGTNTGLSSTGSFNAFFGSNAGFSNISGSENSFFGNGSGLNHTSGSGNSFFGRSAGESVTFAANNSFFGTYAGENTTTGGNSYFGAFAGQKNTTGFGNVFVGANAGKENTGGSSNTYLGVNTGQNPGAVGDNNTVIGANAKVGPNVNNATAIGANSFASTSNSIQLGTALTKVFVSGGLSVEGTATFANGIGVSGTITGSNLNISGGDMFTAFENSTFKLKLPNGTVEASGIHASGNVVSDGAVVADQEVEAEWLVWRNMPGIGSSNEICYYQFAGGAKYGMTFCSSSIRYKENVQDFTSGLDIVRQLRPVTYNLKRDGKHELGFIAEEVNKVEPLLSTFNGKGEVEGVKYAQITTVLVNAVKEQQKQIDEQKAQIDMLKALVCSQNPTAAVCMAKPADPKTEVK